MMSIYLSIYPSYIYLYLSIYLSIYLFSELIAATPARIQANYMMWRAAAASMGYLTEAADKVS